MELIDLINQNKQNKKQKKRWEMPKGERINKLSPLIEIPRIEDDEITIIRTQQSVGDAIMILGGIQNLYDLGMKVYLKIHENSMPLFENHPAIYKLQNLFEKNHTEIVINLSNPCPAAQYESNALEIELNRIDLFAFAMGATKPSKPQLYLTDDEIQWGFNWQEKRKKDRIVGIVPRCAKDGMYRTYPYMSRLVRVLAKKYQIVYIDENFKLRKKGIFNTVGVSLRQLMSIIYHLDCIITSDTGQMHIAGALDKQQIVLFGPTDGKIRCNYYQNVHIIKDNCEEMPCWYNYCCNMFKVAPCMKAIKVDVIEEELDNLWKN